MNTYLLITLIALQIGDIASTVIGLRNAKLHEANPLLAPLFKRFGVLPVLLVIKGALIAWVICYGQLVPLVILCAAVLGYCYVIYNNVKLIRNP